jgi:signal transduction histidine kinase
MRLADFIVRDMQAILAQWEAFAACMPAATNMTPMGLRDHAQQILEAVVKDLSTSQARDAQSAKSMGGAAKAMEAPATAAQTHGFLRAQSGFQINQMAGEYRALRASVLRLWMDSCQPEAPHWDDIIRFNEAIDQALAESIAFFSEEVDRARNLFLATLGHDMRTPLQAIQATAAYLLALNAGGRVLEAASRLINSGARMKALLDDLVEFNRIRLGLGITLYPGNVDVAALFADGLEELRAAHPDRRLELEVTGHARALWDGPRVQRLLGNLVVNALRYGAQDSPVRVVGTVDDADVRFEVRNTGPAIDPLVLEQLFEPLKRGAHRQDRHDRDGSLGLGLYIAREIARAHGGEIDARSEETETVFAVRLPRAHGFVKQQSASC